MPNEEKQTFSFKEIGNTEKLGRFEKALPSVLVKSDTKKVIQAASDGGKDGDWSNYTAAIKNLNLKRITDYNFVLVIFSPVIAAMQSILNYVAIHGNSLNEQADRAHKELKTLVEKVLAHRKFTDLCNAIGSGNGPLIKYILEEFVEYKQLLLIMSGSKYGLNNDDFMKRAYNISAWRFSGKYIRSHLFPFIAHVFPSRYAVAINMGLGHQTQSTLPPDGVAPTPEKKELNASNLTGLSTSGTKAVIENSSDDTDYPVSSHPLSAGSVPQTDRSITSTAQITLPRLLLEIKDGHFEKVPLDVLHRGGFLRGVSLEDIRPDLIIIQNIVKKHYDKLLPHPNTGKRDDSFVANFSKILFNIQKDISLSVPLGDQLGYKPYLIMDALTSRLKHK